VEADVTDVLDISFLTRLEKAFKTVLVLTTDNAHSAAAMRRAFVALINANCDIPVVIKKRYDGLDKDRFQLFSATDAGALLIDGLGDGIWLEANQVDAKTRNQVAFGILQATRTRISKTEYISCPSCGRTLFDLQETTAKIRARTDHLKGIKIGIMGCIVNGPGEMADADYGYVGTGPGKITLYKEKEVVKRNVPAEHAVDELIELIRTYGDWIEPRELEYQ
jgi:(E)-4-hydroxy-3-methylbut-2-enyl-diphosphate synthase